MVRARKKGKNRLRNIVGKLMPQVRGLSTTLLTQGLFNLSMTSYFVVFGFALFSPSSVPAVAWYTRTSLATLWALMIASVVYFIAIVLVVIVSTKKRFSFAEGVLFAVAFSVPVTFVLGVSVVPGENISGNTNFHLLYAIVITTLFFIVGIWVSRKLKNTRDEAFGTLFYFSAIHIDIPIVITFIILLTIFNAAERGWISITLNDLEIFISGALTFEVTMLQTSLLLIHPRVSYRFFQWATRAR